MFVILSFYCRIVLQKDKALGIDSLIPLNNMYQICNEKSTTLNQQRNAIGAIKEISKIHYRLVYAITNINEAKFIYNGKRT